MLPYSKYALCLHMRQVCQLAKVYPLARAYPLIKPYLWAQCSL